jgi:hypothetical protein
MRPLRPMNQRGVTLPMAILWIALLLVAAIAGFGRVSAERRIAGNQEGEAEALALARTGLDRYFAAVTGPPAASFDTTMTGLPGGTVQVSVRRMRAATPALPALYVVRARGTTTASTRYDALTPAAQRTMAQLAIWRAGSMGAPAAWTSITGLKKNGGSGTISGFDACSAAPSVAGVGVPQVTDGGSPGYSQNGGSPVPTGTPPIAYLGASPAAAATAVTIDWNGIVNGGALPADYSLTGTSGWPSSFTNWPTIYVNNGPTGTLSLNPGYSGRGLLVVRGNLVVSGSFSWDGVILVGGTLRSNGNNTVLGAVVSGLNLKLGEAVPESDLGNGTKTYQYSSCNVSSALAGFSALTPIANAWVDNWPVY